MDAVKPYLKFAVAFLAAAAGAAVMYLDDNKLTSQEVVLVVLAGLGALGVYVVPNKPKPE